MMSLSCLVAAGLPGCSALFCDDQNALADAIPFSIDSATLHVITDIPHMALSIAATTCIHIHYSCASGTSRNCVVYAVIVHLVHVHEPVDSDVTCMSTIHAP